MRHGEADVMLRYFFVVGCALTIALASARHAASAQVTAASPSTAVIDQWKQFFSITLPAAEQNFESLRGPANNIPFLETYAVTARFPSIMQDCDLDHGGRPGATFWSIACQVPVYSSTAPSSVIARDISAALPDGYARQPDQYREMRWRKGSVSVAATIISDNMYSVLVCHDVDPKGCDA